ncbi:MAG: hypothetical protein M0R77_21270 [Gammaproteobacteria bacterium]|jgi:hypothetical protein|nr:hypothetical protein [Acholeplasmataceae bacterium]MCK9533011.1 hypothetical protein [Gammaproteobacteria bacterium]MDY0101071.1 hypothetical protein [Bacilli bacterium]
MIGTLQKKLINCKFITNNNIDHVARFKINTYLKELLDKHDVDDVFNAVATFTNYFSRRSGGEIQNKEAYFKKIVNNALINKTLPDVTFKTEPHPSPAGELKINSDLMLRAKEIFVDYDGNNRNEIFELRKLWEPKCSKCKSVMEFWKFTEEFEIGHPPASIFKCPNCVNFYHVEVSRKQEVNGVIRPKTVTWAYGEDPEEWSDEVLAKILASIFGEKQ